MSTESSIDGELYGATAIRNNQLERFENRTLVRRYTVEFTCPEFTCLCPRSGFPDFATILIKYSPDKKCVELKSLKLYINQFRDRKVFHEDGANVKTILLQEVCGDGRINAAREAKINDFSVHVGS